MSANLSGNLAVFGLDEILHLMTLSDRTAAIELTSAQGSGVVRVVEGLISDALVDVRGPRTDRVADSDAGQDSDELGAQVLAHLGELLSWREGSFEVAVGYVELDDRGVRLEVSEAVRRGQEHQAWWASLQESLPESKALLELVPDLLEVPTLEVSDWSLIARVDGRTSLEAVLTSSGLPVLVAAERMSSLIGQGMVRSLELHESPLAAPEVVSFASDAPPSEVYGAEVLEVVEPEVGAEVEILKVLVADATPERGESSESEQALDSPTQAESDPDLLAWLESANPEPAPAAPVGVAEYIEPTSIEAIDWLGERDTSDPKLSVPLVPVLPEPAASPEASTAEGPQFAESPSAPQW